MASCNELKTSENTITDLDPKVLTAAVFDGGVVSSEKFGNLNIQGVFLFVSPACNFPNIDIKKIDEAQEWLNIEVQYILDSNKRIINTIKNTTEIAFNIAPALKWPSLEMKTYLKANVFLWSLDDYCDNLIIRGNENHLKRDSLFEMANIVGNIFLGKYSSISDIMFKNTSKYLYPLCKLMFSVYLELRQLVPNDYESKILPMSNSWRNLILHCLTHETPSGSRWDSDEVHLAVRLNSGVIPMAELLALLEGIHLHDEVLITIINNIFESIKLILCFYYFLRYAAISCSIPCTILET